MAMTKRTVLKSIVIECDESGNYMSAVRTGQVQALEDGVVIGERNAAQVRTLAQVKADVAALT